MTEDLERPRRILAVADVCEDTIAVETAMALAERHDAQVDVMVCLEAPHDLSILSRLSGTDPETLIAHAVASARTAMRDTLSKVMPGRPHDPTVRVGKTYLEIIRHVRRTDCNFVVKAAARPAGTTRLLFNSTDQHLLRKCPCPVWLQRPAATARPKCILAAVDLDVSDAAEPGTLTALNRRVADAACMIAGGPDAEIILLHAWEAPGEGMIWMFSGEQNSRLSADRYVNETIAARHAAMTRMLASLRHGGGSGPRLSPRLVRGAQETVLQEQVRHLGVDVVVMGTVARTGLKGVFIGNTAENIINSLECPVLAVKPDGFVSPIPHD